MVVDEDEYVRAKENFRDIRRGKGRGKDIDWRLKECEDEVSAYSIFVVCFRNGAGLLFPLDSFNLIQPCTMRHSSNSIVLLTCAPFPLSPSWRSFIA